MTSPWLPADLRRRIRKLQAHDEALLRELLQLVDQLQNGAGPPDRYRNVVAEQQTGERAVYGIAGLNVALAELGHPMEPAKALVYAAMILFGEAWPRALDTVGVTHVIDQAITDNRNPLFRGNNSRATRAFSPTARGAAIGRHRQRRSAVRLPAGPSRPSLPAPGEEE